MSLKPVIFLIFKLKFRDPHTKSRDFESQRAVSTPCICVTIFSIQALENNTLE